MVKWYLVGPIEAQEEINLEIPNKEMTLAAKLVATEDKIIILYEIIMVIVLQGASPLDMALTHMQVA